MRESRRRSTQPDYGKWQLIELGMSYEQVAGFLGDPEHDRGNVRVPGKSYYLSYGQLELPSVPRPSPYRFIIGFDVNERVWMKADPVNGVFSPNGVPSKPEALIPLDGSIFSHYPRVLDIRWNPVSEDYPVLYEIEIVARAGVGNEWHVVDRGSEIVSPYYICTYVGAGDARFRVRGTNRSGAGEWSEYRHFCFAR